MGEKLSVPKPIEFRQRLMLDVERIYFLRGESTKLMGVKDLG